MSESALGAEIARKVASRITAEHGPEAMRDEFPGYVRKLGYNLAPGISTESFLEDFSDVGKRELVSRGGRPGRIHAVDSSAVLAINTFARFRISPSGLRLAGCSGFTFASFEKRLRTGLGGTPPSLDFYALGDEGIVAAEGKFTEVLSSRTAGFSASYGGAVSQLADERWGEMYESLCSDPRRFRRLDAAQLVKHYLGMKYTLSDEPQPKVLLYLFWEPVNWPRVDEFARHRREVLEFSMSVAGGDIEFAAISYPELWDSWEEAGLWSGEEGVLEYLRERYVFEVRESQQ